MSAEETADLVRCTYHASNAPSLGLIPTLSSEDLTCETPGTSPIAGRKVVSGIDVSAGG